MWAFPSHARAPQCLGQPGETPDFGSNRHSPSLSRFQILDCLTSWKTLPRLRCQVKSVCIRRDSWIGTAPMLWRSTSWRPGFASSSLSPASRISKSVRSLRSAISANSGRTRLPRCVRANNRTRLSSGLVEPVIQFSASSLSITLETAPRVNARASASSPGRVFSIVRTATQA